MIRRVPVQSDAHKAPQRQRVRQPPGNPALRPDALEIPDQQRPKVNPRRQRRTPVLGRIELRTPLLDKLVEALGLQQLIQTLIKRMPWSRRQLGVRDPDLLLLLPLLARPHRHAPILQTNSVDTVKVLAYEPGLAPRAARPGIGFGLPLSYCCCLLWEPISSFPSSRGRKTALHDKRRPSKLVAHETGLVSRCSCVYSLAHARWGSLCTGATQAD